MFAREVSADDIHLQLVEVYGSAVIPRQQVANSCRVFASARRNVTDDSRSSSATEVNTARVGEVFQMDRCVTLLRMTFDLGVSYGKICQRVPRAVTDNKAASMIACL